MTATVVEVVETFMDSASISASEPDWSREECQRWWDPGRQLLKCIRRYQSWKKHSSPVSWVMCRWYVLWHRFWGAVSGADIPLNCQIAGGLLMPHPNGVVIHPNAYIGPNCLILQQVTIVGGVHLKGHVDIGAGAKIIRPVSIGEHARIGANAVVLNDVPANRTAVGMPAHITQGSNKPS